MPKENLLPKEYKTWNTNLIIDTLRIEKSTEELIDILNFKCQRQITRGNFPNLLGELFRLRRQLFIKSRTEEKYNKTIYFWLATPEGGQHSFDLKQIQEARQKLNGDFGLAGA